MNTCIIIDDENKSRETLRKIIERYFDDRLKVLDLLDSVKEGVFAINKYRPDIVFLDIEMPEENGFKLFDYFDIYDFEVIFTTAYQQYAIDAIKFSALDYLLKPINYIDLRDVLKRLEQKQKKFSPQERIEAFLTNMNSQSDDFNKVALPTLDGFQMEKANNLVYCEAEENYSKIYTNRNDVIYAAKSLKQLEEEYLPKNLFYRIHKSYIVNLNYVKSYKRTGGYRIVLENGKTLDIATRRNEGFVKALTKRQKPDAEN